MATFVVVGVVAALMVVSDRAVASPTSRYFCVSATDQIFVFEGTTPPFSGGVNGGLYPDDGKEWDSIGELPLSGASFKVSSYGEIENDTVFTDETQRIKFRIEMDGWSGWDGLSDSEIPTDVNISSNDTWSYVHDTPAAFPMYGIDPPYSVYPMVKSVDGHNWHVGPSGNAVQYRVVVDIDQSGDNSPFDGELKCDEPDGATKELLGRYYDAVGDPVTPSTGNEFHSASDLAGDDLAFGRSYNSLKAPGGPSDKAPPLFGESVWTSELDSTLAGGDSATPPGSVSNVTLRTGDGRLLTFAGYDAGTSKWAVPTALVDEYDSITYNGSYSLGGEALGPAVVVMERSGRKLVYGASTSNDPADGQGQLLAVSRADGTLLRVCRDGDLGRVEEVRVDEMDCGESAPGEVVRFSYSDSSDVTVDAARLSFGAADDEDSVVDYSYVGGFLQSAGPARFAGDDPLGSAVMPVVGTGTAGSGSDIGYVDAFALDTPKGAAFIGAGRQLIADTGNDRVVLVDGNGVAYEFAGTGTAGSGGDGGEAQDAQLNAPEGVAVGPDGTVYVADTANHTIREIAYDGTISRFAGTAGTSGSSGDSGAATSATLSSPSAVAVGPDGSVFVADAGNDRIRKIDTAGVISTYGPTGQLDGPTGLSVSADGTVWVSDTGNDRIVTISTSQTLAVYKTAVDSPHSIVTLPGQDPVVAVGGEHSVTNGHGRKVVSIASGGTVTPLFGSGSTGSAGDWGAATSATLTTPWGMAVSDAGEVLVVDAGTHRVRQTFQWAEERYEYTYSDVPRLGSIRRAVEEGEPLQYKLRTGYDVAGRVKWQDFDSGDHLHMAYGNYAANERDTVVRYCNETWDLQTGACTDGPDGGTDVSAEEYVYSSGTHGFVTSISDSAASTETTRSVTDFGVPDVLEARDGTSAAVDYDLLGRVVQRVEPDPADGWIPPAGTSGCVRDDATGTYPSPDTGSCEDRHFSVSSIEYCDDDTPSTAPVDANRVRAQTDTRGVRTLYYYVDPSETTVTEQTDPCPANGRTEPGKVYSRVGAGLGVVPDNPEVPATMNELLDPLYVTTSIEIDGAGNVVSIADPDGIVTTNTWDADDRLESTTVGNVSTLYHYDAYGRLKATRVPFGGDPDDGLETWNTYDPSGRLTAVVGPALKNRDCSSGCSWDNPPSIPVRTTAYRMDGSTASTTEPHDPAASGYSEDAFRTDYTTLWLTANDAACTPASAGCERIERVEAPRFSGTDSRRFTTETRYNNKGQVIETSTGTGSELATTTFTYRPSLSQVETITTPVTDPNDPAGSSVTAKFDYDTEGRAEQRIVEPNGTTDATRSRYTNYDKRGRVVRELGPIGSDVDAETSGVSNRSCVAYTYRHDYLNADPDEEVFELDEVFETTRGVYDSATTGCKSDGKTPLQRTWQAYDELGRPTITVVDVDADNDAPAFTTSGRIDASGDIDDGDSVTEVTYSDAGKTLTVEESPVTENYTQSVAYSWNPSDTTRRRVTTNSYYSNSEAQLNGSQQPTGDYPGALKSTQRPGELAATSFDYDLGGAQIGVNSRSRGGYYNGNGTTVASVSRTEQVYNTDGTIDTYRYYPTPGTPKATYGTGESRVRTRTDIRGRVIEQTNLYEHVLSSDPSPPTPALATYTYFDNGLLASATNPLGGSDDVVSYGYDSRGNRTSRSAKHRDCVDDSNCAAETVTETWEYDLADRLVAYTDPINVALRDSSSTYTNRRYSYDSLGRVATIWHQYHSNETQGSQTGRREERTYWDSGQLKTATFTDASATATHSWWYNGQRQTTQTSAPLTQDPFDGAVQDSFYTYTPTGQLATSTTPDPYESSPATSTITYTYDLAGNVFTVDYPYVGSTIRFAHDKASRTTGAAIAYLGWWPMATTRYNTDGTLDSEAFAGNSYRKWTYPTTGSRLPTRYQQTIYDSNPDVVTDTNLTWGHDGRLTQDDTDMDAGTPGSFDTTTFYEYDGAGQLTCASRVNNPSATSDCPASPPTDCDESGLPTGTWIYEYDPTGLILCQANGATITTNTYDNNAQLREADDGTTTTIFDWDAEGRQNSIDPGGDIIRTIYGPAGKPDAIYTGADTCDPDGATACTTTQYRDYDAKGQLIWLCEANGQYNADECATQGDTETYAWDNTQATAQILNTRRDTNLFITFYYGTHRYRNATTGNTAGWYAYDYYDNAINTSIIPAPTSYTPHGQPDNPPNQLTYYGYRSELHTPEGNVHLRARDYQPGTGTFTSRDPLDGKPGDVTQTNPYHYVGNDTPNFTDPSGMCRATNVVFLIDYNTGESLGTPNNEPAKYDYNECRGGESTYCNSTELFEDIEGLGGHIPTGYGLGVCGPWQGRFQDLTLRDAADLLGLVFDAVDVGLCTYDAATWDEENLAWDCIAIIPLAGTSLKLGKYGKYGDEIAEVGTAVGKACSFSASTPVLMADGTKKQISDVTEGEYVYATNPETGESGPRQVIATLPHTDQLLTLELSSGDVITTEDHRYWNATDQEWQESQDLDAGDRLLTADGDIVTVQGLNLATIHTDAAYDLTVEEFHSFYVGAGDEDVLVHNCSLDDILSTEHGLQRLTEAGFDDVAIANIKASPTAYEQASGGWAHVAQSGPDSFDLIVVGDRGVITAHRSLKRWELDGLAANHGWTGYP